MAKDQLEDYSNSISEQECRPDREEVKMWRAGMTWRPRASVG